MRVLAAVTTGIVVAAATAGLAVAQKRTGPWAASPDQRGDVPAGLDIVRMELARNADGRLRAEVTMAEPWDTADLRGPAGSTGLASVCMRLYDTRDPTAEPPDWLVCATPARSGDGLVGKVLRDRVDGPPKAVGEARVTRPTARTIYLRFSQTAVRRPATLRFSAEVVTQREKCPKTTGCRDTAPDAPASIRLRLRSATGSR